MHINGIGLLNTILRHILFATGSMIKNRKVKKIEYGIKQVNKLHLQHGFNITRIHADSEFEPPWAEMSYIGIYLSSAPNKAHVPKIEWFNCTVK